MSWPARKYGGLDLNEAILSEDIVNDLKLRSSAIVIFKSVCGVQAHLLVMMLI